MSYPTIYPTGVTVYDPERCFNGYTLFQAKELGALLVDMNGGEVKLWRGLQGFPNKLLKGGQVLGHTGERSTKFGMQDYRDLVQVAWDGTVVWKFNQYEYIEDPGQEAQWMARVHHDYQREGNPVGYYVPGMEALTDRGNTLILGHKNLVNRSICDKNLLDDTVYEVSWEGDMQRPFRGVRVPGRGQECPCPGSEHEALRRRHGRLDAPQRHVSPGTQPVVRCG
jgi:hypothetical protein